MLVAGVQTGDRLGAGRPVPGARPVLVPKVACNRDWIGRWYRQGVLAAWSVPR
jgi:hypothetical protein